jgi:hypothetical protein
MADGGTQLTVPDIDPDQFRAMSEELEMMRKRLREAERRDQEKAGE